jgi:hypothetical protein
MTRALSCNEKLCPYGQHQDQSLCPTQESNFLISALNVDGLSMALIGFVEGVQIQGNDFI